MRARTAALLFFVLLPCQGARAGQALPQGFSEVAKEKLDGLKLVLTDANCSLTAPAADWKWLVFDASQGKNYMCFNPKTGAGFTVSLGRLTNDIDAHTRDQVLAAARQSAAASGAKVANEKYEQTQTPLPGNTWRLYHDVLFKQGGKIGVILYLVKTADHTLVTLQDSTTTGAESKTFAQFVASLKPLK
ncbi:MAG: hypothetical protein NTW87_18760 [Planctomycetota bacterium]|nr:hypothetical protein [Planctomycetota bacterium]